MKHAFFLIYQTQKRKGFSKQSRAKSMMLCGNRNVHVGNDTKEAQGTWAFRGKDFLEMLS